MSGEDGVEARAREILDGVRPACEHDFTHFRFSYCYDCLLSSLAAALRAAPTCENCRPDGDAPQQPNAL